ncbi:hypothetical protein HDU87_001140 [Geranomyces variabilis]|uniref:Uncharacterized protein n=1 Tax=Geranomyces variabilis TaxID=109894 RepID=A0AAD5XP55_9FUNG|nr:hypothetical protein HDU87_001140 [Geranomyces variabilis]
MLRGFSPSGINTPIASGSRLGKRARTDDVLRDLEDIVDSYQQQERTRSLTCHCVLVSGGPSSRKSAIFANKFRAPRQPAAADAAIEALSRMGAHAQSRLVMLVQQYCKDGGVSSVIHHAKAEELLAASARTNLLRETIDILRTIAKRPAARLLVEGTERTRDMWHNPSAVGRNEDWVITLASETSIGKRGVDIGIGDSLGDHEFDSEKGREKICKSARSARDMALAMPGPIGRRPAILWIVQNHKYCIIFAVTALSSDLVAAKYLGHCHQPLLTPNLPLGVATATDLFLRAQTVLKDTVAALSIVQSDSDSSEDTPISSHVIPSPFGKPSAAHSPHAKKIRISKLSPHSSPVCPAKDARPARQSMLAGCTIQQRSFFLRES